MNLAITTKKVNTFIHRSVLERFFGICDGFTFARGGQASGTEKRLLMYKHIASNDPGMQCVINS